MPIEIKELLIKVTVQETNAASGNSGAGSSGPEKSAIVEECIEKVLEILHHKHRDR